MDKKRGVYFLANDRVFDLCVAFLNSFRAHNPDMPLCMVPFNESIQRLEGLRHKYNFSIYENRQAYKRCDEISLFFHKRVLGQYRKLVMWEGDFEEFMYIDVDSVILQDAGPVFKLLSDFEFITATSNHEIALRWIWKKSIYQSGLLGPDQIAYAANTSFICSKKGALRVEEAYDKAKSNYPLRQHIAPCGIEQGLLNYLIVTSGKRYTSLQDVFNNERLRTGSFNYWLAGWRGAKMQRGQLSFSSIPVLIIHWGGLWQPRMLERAVFRFMKILHIKDKDKHPAMRFFMPYKKLWEHYRFMQDN